MIRKLQCLKLRLRYWLQGDSWEDAGEYARFIVYGFKKEG